MRKRASDGPCLGNSIKRDHSPYCESKGPIIQEGFVAQRIRALQELQAHALAGNRSHSPMVPCPPRWMRSYEPLDPPRPALALRPALKVPAMSEYGTIKHHWASMTGRYREEAVERRANVHAISNLQARSTRSPPQTMRPCKSSSIVTNAIQSHDTESRKLSQIEHSEEFQAYVERRKTTRSPCVTVDSTDGNQLIKPDMMLPKSTRSTMERPAHDRELEQIGRLTTPAMSDLAIQATVAPHDTRELDLKEMQNDPIWSAQSLGSSKEIPNRDFIIESDGAQFPPERLCQSISLPYDERPDSATTEPDKSYSTTPGPYQNYDDNFEMSPSRYIPMPPEREILSPNPVPANLANPLTLSRCISPTRRRDSDHVYDYNYDQASAQPRKSVADILGVLVERGWNGSDMFDKAYDQGADAQSVSDNPQGHGDRAGFCCVPSNHKESSNPLSCGVYSSESSINGIIKDYGELECDESHKYEVNLRPFSDPGTQQPTYLEREELHSSPSIVHAERRRSDIGSKSSKPFVFSPANKRRVSSLQQRQGHRRSESEGIELRSFAQDSTVANWQGGTLANLSSLEKIDADPGPRDVVPRHEQEQVPPAAAAPLGSESHQLSIPSNEYLQFSPGSTSWFKKSWLKKIRGEPVQGEDFSYDRSTITSASSWKDGAQQNAFSPHDLQSGDHGRTLPASPPFQPSHTVNHDSFVETLRRLSHEQGGNAFHRSATSTTSVPISPSSTRIPERVGTASPKRAGAQSKNSEPNLQLSNDQLPNPHSPRKLSPTSPSLVSVRIHRINEISAVPPTPAIEGLRAGSTSERFEQSERQFSEEKHVRRDWGKRNTIRKIQVIITFDGVEDLVIEATTAGDTVQRN